MTKIMETYQILLTKQIPVNCKQLAYLLKTSIEVHSNINNCN